MLCSQGFYVYLELLLEREQTLVILFFERGAAPADDVVAPARDDEVDKGQP